MFFFFLPVVNDESIKQKTDERDKAAFMEMWLCAWTGCSGGRLHVKGGVFETNFQFTSLTI